MSILNPVYALEPLPASVWELHEKPETRMGAAPSTAIPVDPEPEPIPIVPPPVGTAPVDGGGIGPGNGDIISPVDPGGSITDPDITQPPSVPDRAGVQTAGFSIWAFALLLFIALGALYAD